MFFTAPSARTLATAGLLILLGSNLLIRTKPTHSGHVARLFPGPTPIDLLAEPPSSEFMRRNYPPTSNTAFKDAWIVSTTRSKATGAVSSIGVLGMVFDVRNETQREIDRRAFDAAREPPIPVFVKPIRPSFLSIDPPAGDGRNAGR